MADWKNSPLPQQYQDNAKNNDAPTTRETNGETNSLQEPCPMNGGDGPHSYSQNSSFQKAAVDGAKRMINEGVAEKLDFNSLCFSNTFRIADFGCSVGPNTFYAVENIIEAVEAKYQSQQQQPRDCPRLEFQVFFNDLTGNDFNTLFKSLCSYGQKYFAAGVPGSFYGRLFPESSLHLAHSSYAMHWLSKVPREIVDSNSPAWNKGSIYCTGHEKEVAKAYSAQFRNDMSAFLDARAHEIVGGGLMLIILPGLPDGITMQQSSTGAALDVLGSSLAEMVKQGFFSEQKVESFNLPMYYTSTKELEEIIKENGFFVIEGIETWKNPILNVKPSAEFTTKACRAGFEGLLKQHFGDENAIDRIFHCFTEKFEESDIMMNDEARHRQIEMFFLLKRKL